MKRLILAVALAAVPFSSVMALETPNMSQYDHRIKYVTFNPDNVVQLDTVIGVVTHIKLEQGETYQTHAFGDSAAYDFAVVGSNVFVKPAAEEANTNLIIVTDRRSYNFRLSFRPDRARATYALGFRYPDTAARLTAAQVEKQRVGQAFATKASEANLNYTMSGNTDIAPINAWDDGRFTYLKFAANADFPAVYVVDTVGNESLVNFNTIGTSSNIIQIHKVHPKFFIRSGSRVLAIFNEAYDSVGTPNETGTASPAVERVIQGGQ